MKDFTFFTTLGAIVKFLELYLSPYVRSYSIGDKIFQYLRLLIYGGLHVCTGMYLYHSTLLDHSTSLQGAATNFILKYKKNPTKPTKH